MPAKSRSTMHEVKKFRSFTERWRSRSRATRLMPESRGFLPPPPVEVRRSKQDQVKLVHQQGGARALSIKHVWERPGGRALRCPDLHHVTLPRLPTPTKDRGCDKVYKLPPPVQRRLYAAYLSPASEKGVLFCLAQLFFILGNRGLSAEPGYLCFPTYETKSDGDGVQLLVVPTLCPQ